MKRKTKNTLRALAKHFGLKVVFVHHLPDDVQGKLLPREKRILINALKPRCEHAFTMLHEIGHYVVHVLAPRRKYHPRIFDIHWKINFLAELSKRMRRSIRFAFNRTAGKEWEADLWAMCAYVEVAKLVDDRDEFMSFMDCHPEKTNLFLFVACVSAYYGVKTRIKYVGKCLSSAFPMGKLGISVLLFG